ncbi:predicted hydrolase of the HD superfamily [Rothia mucilaginosa DY-18]|uniref:Predicted hydrolase of the HD superfamily n=1 Tax=Rothia mucilaginosa (strain DY-18) TaxID=680646 RepID=D2NRE5_ROTMD|nr:predicted hydrolase of the HD superfamily [Rothia mucilaginosa DY-18]
MARGFTQSVTHAPKAQKGLGNSARNIHQGHLLQHLRRSSGENTQQQNRAVRAQKKDEEQTEHQLTLQIKTSGSTAVLAVNHRGHDGHTEEQNHQQNVDGVCEVVHHDPILLDGDRRYGLL